MLNLKTGLKFYMGLGVVATLSISSILSLRTVIKLNAQVTKQESYIEKLDRKYKTQLKISSSLKEDVVKIQKDNTNLNNNVNELQNNKENLEQENQQLKDDKLKLQNQNIELEQQKQELVRKKAEAEERINVSSRAKSESLVNSKLHNKNDNTENQNTKSNNGFIVNASAYTNSPEENGGYNVTALGTSLNYGVIAVDPKVIPLRSKVRISHMNGQVMGVFRAEDTGGAIKGNRIDILLNSKDEARNFGRRKMKVEIIK